MKEHASAVLFAVVLWWSTTALAIHLNGLPRRTFNFTFAGTTVVMAVSLWAMIALSGDKSVVAAYTAFACGLLYWAWQDVSFYLGKVTGWRKERCPEDCAGWRHFVHAIEASIYHELAILVAAAVAFVSLWGAPNEIGLWTFCILWWMHQSAKLNVFLGVTNLNTEFLPEQLRFLEGYFRKRPMNLLFPVSITISTIAAAWLGMEAAKAPAGSFEAIGYTMLATLMVLAVLEHWFLVLPLPFEKLWKWAIVPSPSGPACTVEVVAGKLGAGKTTYLRNVLASVRRERTVVLVNDFADLGIDASLLSDRGANVVELPNGCICCSLRNDLAAEVGKVLAAWRPSRLFVEPSGVADVGALLQVLNRPGLLPAGSTIEVTGIFDASSFLRTYAQARSSVEAQARLSSRVIISKADLADEATISLIADTIRALSPAVRISAAVGGAITREISAAAAVHMRAEAPASDPHAGTAHAAHDHGHHPFESWSAPLASTCGVDELRALLARVATGTFGSVERLKGIAETNAGWVSFDIAGGRPSMSAFAPGALERPRVMAIGTNVDKTSLANAFKACRMNVTPELST